MDRQVHRLHHRQPRRRRAVRQDEADQLQQRGRGDASRIIDAQYQTPAYNGGTPIVGPQTAGPVANPDAHDKTTNCRHDVITELYGTSESGPGQASTLYKVPLYYTTPRYVQFGVSYDF